MVCRGTFSEGYNFNDEMARGVFIIGVPNLNIKDIKFNYIIIVD